MTELAPPRQEDDVLSTRPVLLVLVGTLAAAIVMVAWVWLLVPAPSRARRPFDRGMVPAIEGELFETRPAPSAPTAKRAVLESYGWVDRERGIVRIPVERAMDLAAEEP